MFDTPAPVNPDKNLWQAVLLRAVDDALFGTEGVSRPAQRIAIIREARAFLTSPSGDLTTICHLAGLDPQAVLDHMRQRISEAPTPEELATSRKVMLSTATGTAKPRASDRVLFKDRLFTLNGITRTAAEWSERTGISLKTLQNRIDRGWGAERAMTLTTTEARAEAMAGAQHNASAATRGKSWNRGTPAKRLTHAGKTHTLKEWAEITGIKIGTIKARLAQGATIAQALDPRNLRGKSLQDRMEEEAA